MYEEGPIQRGFVPNDTTDDRSKEEEKLNDARRKNSQKIFYI